MQFSDYTMMLGQTVILQIIESETVQKSILRSSYRAFQYYYSVHIQHVNFYDFTF